MKRARFSPFRWLRALQVFALALVCVTGAMAQDKTPNAAASDEARLDVLEYVVEGNTLLTPAAIETVLTPFLGPGRPMADVEAARAALEKVYQGAGYLTVFVDVPEQRVEAGVVTLKVLEGRVERLSVTGSRYFSQGYIRERVTEFAEGRVPNFNTAQRELSGVNRSDERRVQPVLRPGLTPGTVEIELKVSDELPLESTFELNNRHAVDTEALRLSGTVRYANLFQRDHAIALTGITAPADPKQSTVVSGTYTVPLDSGNTFVAYALASDSTLEPLGAATVIGKGYTLGVRWVVPLSAAPSDGLHTLMLGADYKDLRERVASAGVTVLSTPLRYLPFQAAYSGSWQDGAVQTSFNGTFTFGIRRLLARTVDCPGNIGPVDQFACKREGADGGFSTLRIDARQSRPMPLGGTLGLRLGGQLATQPLASSEQYSAGGAESVRGYYEGEASGDHALFGSLEWRSPNFAKHLDSAPKPVLDELTLLGFVDVAQLYTLMPSAGQNTRTPLLGSGFGVRARAWRSFSAELDIGWPLKATSRTPDRDARLHARIVAKF